MLKKIILVFLIGVSINTSSQETLIVLKNSLKTSATFIKDVIPIVNKVNDEIAFFVVDAKNVYGYRIDSNFKVLGKIKSEDKSSKYKTLITETWNIFAFDTIL